ncbi:kinase-like protein [Schizophyllum fasciatum]
MTLAGYTDSELECFFANSPSITTTRQEVVRRISPHLVAKPVPWLCDPQDEVLALRLARSVGVNVPIVQRVVSCEDESHLIIMDYIDGMTLEQAWRSMSLFATLRVAWQLRAYLRSTASIVAQTTGGVHSGRSHSEWLQGQYGPVPHASPTLYRDYLNWWLTECRPAECRPRRELLVPAEPHHILVHQDLAPRNMILDSKGALWVIDWGHAGFYPPYMEYGGMEAMGHAMPWLSAPTWAAWWGRLRWSLLRLIAFGYRRYYDTRLKALEIVRQRSLRYRLARGPFSEER